MKNTKVFLPDLFSSNLRGKPVRFFSVLIIVLLFSLLLLGNSVYSSNPEELPRKPIRREVVNPKLQTVLQKTIEEADKSIQKAKKLANQKGIQLDSGRVTVIIEPEGGRSANVDVRSLESLGGKVQRASKSLIRATIPLEELTSVSTSVKGIDFIRLPRKPQPLKLDTTEGESLIGADTYQNDSITGEGVKIAIIDVGFDHLTEAKNSDDIPPGSIVFTKDYTESSGLESESNHGTDVTEIVHDIAPGAELYLMKVGDAADLEDAVDFAISNGVDVINHSLGWYNFSYYDGTGDISNIAADARAEGILWVNAAGNNARAHWQGDFNDSNDDRWHEFAQGDASNSLGTVNEGNTINIYLTWNSWPSDPQDYDLYLLDGNNTIVAEGDDYQRGSQPPTERVNYSVSEAGNYSFAILNRSAPDRPEMDVFVNISLDAFSLEYYHEESSIMDPASDERVITVGAINVNNWLSGPQAYYSSRGPTNLSKFSSRRVKPDLVAPDGVSTSGYGSFYGTSASTPHVAGAAALLIAENPGRTPTEVRTILESEAEDMGITGEDNIYGNGRMVLGSPEEKPPIISDFEALGGDKEAELSWTNPSLGELAQVVVRRKSGEYPSGPWDGNLVYDDVSPLPGELVTYVDGDSDLVNGNTYFYAVFSKNSSGTWNTAVEEGNNAGTAKLADIAAFTVEKGGWNMVSVPVDPMEPAPYSVFEGVSGEHGIYHWETAYSGNEGSYISKVSGMDAIHALRGYWVYVNNGDTCFVSAIMSGKSDFDKHHFPPRSVWTTSHNRLISKREV